MLRIGTHDVFAIVRLASADTALSSGRSEWKGALPGSSAGGDGGDAASARIASVPLTGACGLDAVAADTQQSFDVAGAPRA